MNEVFSGLLDSVSIMNVLWLLAGTLAGIIIGALPGIGPTVGISLLIPFTFGMEPITALILAGGIYTGGIYGGSLTAILIGVPDSTNAATLFDGYPMARKGRSLEACSASVFASAFGGFVSALCLLFLTEPISKLVTQFGVAEQFMMSMFGLSVIAVSAKGSIIKGLISGLLGLGLSMIGYDAISGALRFDFGTIYFADGLPVVAAIVGLFGIGESLALAEEGQQISSVSEIKGRVKDGFVSTIKHWYVTLRSIIIGCILGATPGAGSSPACMISYSVTSVGPLKEGEAPYGEGNVKGVIASEAANNATVGTALIPTLAFGIPGSTVAAVIMSLLTLHGIPTGTRLFVEIPTTAYTFFWSLLFANIALIILSLPLIKPLSRVTVVPYQLLIPTIIALCIIGVYSINGRMFDVALAVGIGLGAFFLKKGGFPSAPFVLGLLLGRSAEQNLSRALIVNKGFSFLYTRPICRVLAILIVLMIAVSYLPVKKWLNKLFKINKKLSI